MDFKQKKVFPLVSVEIPVFAHHYLKETIQSVINQTYTNWKLLLLSDGASSEAQDLMRKYAGEYENGVIEAHYQENRGISETRKKLATLSASEFMFPLDHDDLMFPTLIEDMIHCFTENPEAGIVRARRILIDENSKEVRTNDWFPFQPRRYFEGMTVDIHNHCQPFMLKRSAYAKTSGWEGFSDLKGAGEDCDIFLKMEEIAGIALLDKVLYGYRVNPHRFSLELGMEGTRKIYSALADKTIKRRGLNLKRLNEFPPFKYEKLTSQDNNG